VSMDFMRRESFDVGVLELSILLEKQI